jgi:hypothetical protein
MATDQSMILNIVVPEKNSTAYNTGNKPFV